VTNLSRTVVSPAVVQGLSALAAGTVFASSTDPDGNVTKWQLDAVGRPLQQVAADGGVTKYGYSNGFVSSVTDPLGRTTTLARDAQGYVTQTTLPDGSTISYQYQSAFHALTTLTNELNNTSTLPYDASGHLTSSTDALSERTGYGWSAGGLLTSVTDPSPHFHAQRDKTSWAATDYSPRK
jgi:YD repeat-containing protein